MLAVGVGDRCIARPSISGGSRSGPETPRTSPAAASSARRRSRRSTGRINAQSFPAGRGRCSRERQARPTTGEAVDGIAGASRSAAMRCGTRRRRRPRGRGAAAGRPVVLGRDQRLGHLAALVLVLGLDHQRRQPLGVVLGLDRPRPRRAAARGHRRTWPRARAGSSPASRAPSRSHSGVVPPSSRARRRSRSQRTVSGSSSPEIVTAHAQWPPRTPFELAVFGDLLGVALVVVGRARRAGPGGASRRRGTPAAGPAGAGPRRRRRRPSCATRTAKRPSRAAPRGGGRSPASAASAGRAR